MDRRYPGTERLRGQREIDAVFKRGRRVFGPHFRLHARPNGLAVSRFAVSVPGRVCNAVKRNRWKRLLRESFRLNKEAIGPGLDLVAVPTKPPGDLKRQEVEAVLIRLARKARGA